MKKDIFFAYESGHQDNIDAISKACSEYNSHQKSFCAKTWEELKVGGKIINKTILDAIDNCEIFACDLTYLNHNVLFEFGYAIAKKKKILVFLNNSVKDAAQNYQNFRIFKNIGYESFINYKNIQKELQGRAHVQTRLLEQIIKFDERKLFRRLGIFSTAPAIPVVKVANNESSAPPIPSGTCVICLDRKSDTIAIPCGHYMYCDLCTKNLENICSVCRGKVTEWKRVYE